MKSVSRHVIKKFKTVQDIVHGQDFFVVVVAFLFREIIYSTTKETHQPLFRVFMVK